MILDASTSSNSSQTRLKQQMVWLVFGSLSCKHHLIITTKKFDFIW